jgi:hypothetical protein
MMNEWLFKPGGKIESYEIREPLGKSQNAEVYLAHHKYWRMLLRLRSSLTIIQDVTVYVIECMPSQADRRNAVK